MRSRESGVCRFMCVFEKFNLQQNLKVIQPKRYGYYFTFVFVNIVQWFVESVIIKYFLKPCKKGGRYSGKVILQVVLLADWIPHFWVRPVCVVVSSSLWNRGLWAWILEPDDLVVDYSIGDKDVEKESLPHLFLDTFHNTSWCLLWYKCRLV